MGKRILKVLFTLNGENYSETIPVGDFPSSLSTREFRDSIVRSLKSRINYDSSHGVLKNVQVESLDF